MSPDRTVTLPSSTVSFLPQFENEPKRISGGQQTRQSPLASNHLVHSPASATSPTTNRILVTQPSCGEPLAKDGVDDVEMSPVDTSRRGSKALQIPASATSNQQPDKQKRWSLVSMTGSLRGASPQRQRSPSPTPPPLSPAQQRAVKNTLSKMGAW